MGIPFDHVLKMACVLTSSETEDDDFLVLNSVNETSGFRCTYPGCSSIIKYRKHLKDNLRGHTGERPYKCDECDKSFVRPYHLKRHQVMHSTDESGVKCYYENCSYRCKFNSNLKRHIRRIHENKKPFKCSFNGCPVAFKKHKDKTAHEALHRGEKPFKCEEKDCDKCYASHHKLKEHMKKHKKEKGYVCSNENCDSIFYSWSDLQKHKFVCTVHKCEDCGKIFKAAWQLKKHKVIHDCSRHLFKCPVEQCDRKYTTESNVVAHVRSCHGEQKTFVCPEESCQQSFAHKCSLKRHLANHERILEMYNRIARNRKKREKKRRKQTRIRTSTLSKISGVVSELDRFISTSDTDAVLEDEGYSETGEEDEDHEFLLKETTKIMKPSACDKIYASKLGSGTKSQVVE